MNRARKTTGRIAFVGAGPGDAGMLTVRAQQLLTSAALLVTDPDVPADILALVAQGAEVRPAVGEPGDVAKDLITEAKSGQIVVRLVSGDPLTADAVVAEALDVGFGMSGPQRHPGKGRYRGARGHAGHHLEGH